MENVKSLVKECVANKKNYNNIVDIIAVLEQENELKVSMAAIRGLEKVFCHIVKLGHMAGTPTSANNEANPNDKLKTWLNERYAESQLALQHQLHQDNPKIQEQALLSLLKILQYEGQYPIQTVQGYYFPVKFLEGVVKKLVTSKKKMSTLITRFQEFLDFEDIKLHILRALSSLLKSYAEQAREANDIFLENTINLLEHIVLTDRKAKKQEEEESVKLYCLPKSCKTEDFNFSYTQSKKYYSSVWRQVLTYRLTPALYRKVLILLPDKVMPHLEKPLLLTDFFTESYNIGGAISLLALNGVFVLIQKHHLEYPEFYKKLYSLLEPTIFHARYKSRFFYLANLFMTSTHLPEYVAAAFAKKLARLALTAPSPSLVLIFPFISNLMLRHRGLFKLIHNPERNELIDKDPYDPEEKDPAKCKATESSLWEIKTLEEHVLPEVASAAKFIERELPKMESDLADYLEITWEDMMEKETKRKIPAEVPMNYEKPQKLACVKNEKFSQIFSYW
nr:EOG090X04ZD [Triops cancriformis]